MILTNPQEFVSIASRCVGLGVITALAGKRD